MAFGWKLYEGGKTPPVGAAVAPDERLSWPRTVGIGAQHVVAMFGATFVFPVIMGLNPNLAIMMSGIATIIFLLIVSNRIPSYLGTSAAFVGGVTAIRAQGGSSSDVVGSILISGVVRTGFEGFECPRRRLVERLRLTGQLRCYVPEPVDETWGRFAAPRRPPGAASRDAVS